jgi:hypothetical protein
MNDIVATYCGLKKNAATGFLPALERYIGSHIRKAQVISLEHKRPLFFLSGMYGLIEATQPISWYEYKLEKPDPDFTRLIAMKLISLGAQNIWWLTKGDEHTRPYDDTIRQAVLWLQQDNKAVTLQEYDFAVHA